MNLSCVIGKRRASYLAFRPIGLSTVVLFVLTLLLSFFCSPSRAQSNTSAKYKKLPSPEKIVNDYLKAIGGKKKVAAIKDATYEWTLVHDDAPLDEVGTATLHLKAPASAHGVLNFKYEHGLAYPDDGVKGPKRSETGVTMRSAWTWNSVAGTQTLTDAEAHTQKLFTILDASRLIDYKKSKVLARTAGVDESSGEPAYIVEFSLRNGARVRYFFSISRKLLIATEYNTPTLPVRRTFSDFRNEQGLFEPHKNTLSDPNLVLVTFRLKQVRYNTGLNDSIFDPPSRDVIDVGAILSDIDRNQEITDMRVGEYTYTEKFTERKINDRGEITEENVKIFEVYPVADGRDVKKLISENGVLLSADKAEREIKRVTEDLAKAERERIKAVEKRERDKQKGKAEKSDDDVGIGDFLRAAELVSPRRERLRDRDAIVFDFRPRSGYKPKGSVESIVSKLAGVVWVDPVDKQVMRLEARLIESYKMGGGLLASVRPGTALVFEQKRMEDGVWLPVFAQVNISAKILLFKGINMNVVQEFSNYQKFKSNVDDYKIASP